MSGITERLRSRLDALGVEWEDGTEDYRYESGLRTRIERTRWTGLKGEQASAIIGWTERDGERMRLTYGWPDALEVLFEPYSPEPAPMDEDMALRITLGK